MDKLSIRGGGKLKGTIEVKGAKNDALAIFAASLLAGGPVTVTNVPEIEDIRRLSEIMEKLGVKVRRLSAGSYRIDASGLNEFAIDRAMAKKIRASILLTAPLIVRLGRVKFPHPGGCVIGARPIDVFLDGYKALGAKARATSNLNDITATKLKGTEFVFDNISVTGTESMIMASVLAEGATVLKNCACEPEVQSVAEFLNSLGANITGAGTPNIVIKGVKKLRGGKHRVIPDRVEAGSFAIMAATVGGDVTVKNCEPKHLDSLLSMLRKAGAKLVIGKNSVRVVSKNLKSVNLKTHEYPGFPTDLQAPFAVLLTQAKGSALVHETIYEGRLNWTEDLKRMGADIKIFDPHRMEITGPRKLRGREIESPDLRAGIAFVIAALCAKGQSTVHNVYQIDRGYEKIEERLRKLGANIKRI